MRDLARDLLALRTAAREVVEDVERLRQDIRVWTHTARRLRERSNDPDHDPACPTQMGIDWSERLLDEAHARYAALRALIAQEDQ